MYSSRASLSPFLIRANKSVFSSLVRSGSRDVLTPQISTLFITMGLPPVSFGYVKKDFPKLDGYAKKNPVSARIFSE